MTASILNPRLPVPAAVRRSVEAEGCATWRRAVSGGVMVLTTRRRGSRLVTRFERVEPIEEAEPDITDFAMV